jgi:hypothetical protein
MIIGLAISSLAAELARPAVLKNACVFIPAEARDLS